jgi:hypothetical protein
MKKFLFTLIPILMAGSVFSQVRLDSGLVAYYPFNGNAQDESGNENHGTVVGAVLTTDRSGNPDAAYEFDGESTYITIPGSASLQTPTTELTELAWVNIYSWSLVAASFGPVFMKSNAQDNQFQYRLSIGPEGLNIAINAWDNYVTIADTLEFEKWYFIAATWKDDTARLFLDGNFIGKGRLPGPAMADNLPLEIGRDAPGGVEFFHGKIDDARIYNRALTDGEIKAVYMGNLGIPEETPYSPFGALYPNPVKDQASILISDPVPQHISWHVYNLSGSEVPVDQEVNLSPDGHILKINVENLSPGIYLYEVRYTSGSTRGKMVVVR